MVELEEATEKNEFPLNVLLKHWCQCFTLKRTLGHIETDPSLLYIVLVQEHVTYGTRNNK